MIFHISRLFMKPNFLCLFMHKFYRVSVFYTLSISIIGCREKNVAHVSIIFLQIYIYLSKCVHFWYWFKLYKMSFINITSWQTAKNECYICGQCFKSTYNLEEHRVISDHLVVPPSSLFQDERYLLKEASKSVSYMEFCS